MTRYRFTLAQLMAIVLFIGFGFAALRSASVLWASAVFTLAVAVLSVAVLGAMARRGRARMTWAGFALFGWVYLGTTFGPWAAVHGVTAPPYATRWPLDYWDATLFSWDARLFSRGGPMKAHRMDTGPSGECLFAREIPPPAFTPSPASTPLVLPPDAFQFRRIGHCLAALLFGLVGAVSGRLLAPRDEQPNP
jgi:hypothetical protein